MHAVCWYARVFVDSIKKLTPFRVT